MSMVKCAAPLAATAVVLGLSLAGPAIATADDSTAGSPTSSAAGATASQTKSSVERRPVRAVRAAARVAATAPTANKSAAARVASAVSQTRSAATPDRTARRESSARTALLPHDSTGSTDRAETALGAAAVSDPAPAAAAAAVSETHSAPTIFRITPRATTMVGALTTPVTARAAASATNILSNLFAPIQSLLEGISLLVRRTFFNQGPSLSPIQITGQSQGVITGNLGGVDPEADPIVYSLTSLPQYGTVVIGSDGNYTYTPGQDFTGTDTFTVSAADSGFHINLLNLFRPASTSAYVTVRQGADVGLGLLQFQFLYSSGSQYWSPAARSSLQSAADAISSYIVVNSPVVVTFDVTGQYLPLSGTLATAGSDFISSDPGFLPTVVQNKILTGVDSNGSNPDGEITWNFAQNWATGDSVAYGEYDLQSVAMHELLHALGFLSYVNAPGDNTGTSWTVFDGYLVNSNGTRVIGSNFAWNSTYNPNLTGTNGGIYFGGPDAVAAYGQLVPLYTPSPWSSGSSLSHLNDRVFAAGNRKLMNAQVASGLGIRVLSPVELGILADIGYTIR